MHKIHQSLREKKTSSSAVSTDNAFAQLFQPLVPKFVLCASVITPPSPQIPVTSDSPYDDASKTEMTANSRQARALSPISPNRGVAPSPLDNTVQKTMDEDSQQGGNHDGNTRDSRDSAISGLSILADDTDTFYQRSLKQLARDQKRLKSAVNSNSVPAFSAQPQAFRKARPGQHRVALTLDNLARNEEPSTSGEAGAGPAIPKRRESVGGGEALGGQGRGASCNMPREWGRKGIQKNDFLKRINSTGGMDKNTQNRPEDPDRIYRRRTLYTGDSPEHSRDLDLDADAAGSSLEVESPLSTKKRPRRVTASTNGNVNTTIDDIMELEKQQVEEPLDEEQHSKAASRLRDVSYVRTQREIDNIKERAVTTSRLADVAKKSLRMSSLAQAFRKTGEPGDGNTHKSDSRSERSGATDTTLAKPKSTGSLKPSEPRPVPGSSRDVSNDVPEASTSPKSTRGDSRALLRRLARASSTTPSPANDPPRRYAASTIPKIEKSQPPSPESRRRESVLKYGSLDAEAVEMETRHKRASSLHAKVPSRSSSLRSSDGSPRQAISRIPLVQSPTRSSGRSGISARLSDDNETPLLVTVSNTATPKITGAWFETPKNGKARMPALPQEPSLPENEQPQPLQSHPVYPQRRSSSGDRSHRRQSSDPPASRHQPQRVQTESGRDIPLKREDAPASDAKAIEADLTQIKLDLDGEALDLAAKVGTPLGNSPHALRDEEAKAIGRAAQSLRTVRSTLDDVGERIARAKHVFEPKEAPPKMKAQHLPTGLDTNGSDAAQITLFTILANTLAAIFSTFMKRNAKGRRRPTRWGWFAIGLFLYTLAEIRMCKVFCHHVSYWYFPTYHPLPDRRPRVPFMFLYSFILEPIRPVWLPFLEGWRWLWRLCYGKELQWLLYELMKWWKLDWIIAPDPRVGLNFPFPSWWWDRYGGPYGGGRPGCSKQHGVVCRNSWGF